jgi:hypothetical protein
VWVRDFEPELKSQSDEWRSRTSARPKKFRRAQSKVKQMMIFAYGHRGIIMTGKSSTWSKCGGSVLSWLDAKIAQKNAQKPTWLDPGWATHFAWQCTPTPGEGCDRFVE